MLDNRRTTTHSVVAGLCALAVIGGEVLFLRDLGSLFGSGIDWSRLMGLLVIGLICGAYMYWVTQTSPWGSVALAAIALIFSVTVGAKIITPLLESLVGSVPLFQPIVHSSVFLNGSLLLTLVTVMNIPRSIQNRTLWGLCWVWLGNVVFIVIAELPFSAFYETTSLTSALDILILTLHTVVAWFSVTYIVSSGRKAPSV
jgi:hypothetical protein